MCLRTYILCFGLLYMVSSIDGHGRLLDPPSRVSAWRYDFNTPVETTDHGWNCGGRDVQKKLDGKCGVCGDAWNQTEPRDSEPGGKFAKKVTIVKAYTVGENIEVDAEITANHLGYMEYKLCRVTNPSVAVTQECLDQTPLPISDGSGYEFDIGNRYGHIKLKLQLPENFACEHCVLQWRYRGSNNCCGQTQEEFRACADITITNNGGVISPIVVSSTTSTKVTTTSTEAGNVAGPITDGDCSSSSTGLIGDPNDCSRFYSCAPAAEGGWNKVPFSCSAGLVWNTAITNCDWPRNVAGYVAGC